MTHDVDEDGRCARSDLPPAYCAAQRCLPDLSLIGTPVIDANELLLPSQVTARMVARHVSVIACGHYAYPGMVIARGPDGWVCDSCDPVDPTALGAAP